MMNLTRSKEVSVSKRETTGTRQGFTTTELTLAGMFAAVLAVLSQLSIPMPSGVPITIQVFGVALVGEVLGWRLGLFSTLAYVLMGAVGLPVFSGLRGGLSVLTGVTGGYIWAWPVMTVLCGVYVKTGKKALDLAIRIVLALAGLAIVETAGGLQWAALSGDKTVGAIFVYSMAAFVPKDTLITVLAVIIGPVIRRRMNRQIR